MYVKQSDNTRAVMMKNEFDLELYKAKNPRKRRRGALEDCENSDTVGSSISKRNKIDGVYTRARTALLINKGVISGSSGTRDLK